MRKLLGTRLCVVLMAMMIVMSPTASAQSTPQAGDPASTEVAEPVVPAAPETEGETQDVDVVPDAEDQASPPANAPLQSSQAAPDMQVMAAGDGTLVVNVVGSDPDQPVPTGALVCVSVIWNCVPWTGAPLTFTVAPGEYTVSFDMFDESYYTDAISTVVVGADETLDVTLTLEPRQPSTLRLYISTDTGAPIPAGTEACVQQDGTAYTDPVDECQPVTSGIVDFAVNEGWANISVTTLPESGFAGTSDTVWVEGGTIYRDYLVLTDDADATVTIDVATEDGVILNAAPFICFQHANDSLEHCTWVEQGDFDNDGGGNYVFRVPAGTWTWVVEPSFLDTNYLPVTGTVTVTEGEELVIEATLPLRTDADLATLAVDVTTFDGAAVPAGTIVCVSDALSSTCEEWAGEPVILDVAAGAITVDVAAPNGSNYSSFSTFLPLVSTGEARIVDAVLYPLDTPLTMVKTVSDPAPEVGDTVTYTLHAFGPAYEFLIEDVLPLELTDVSVTCQGAFASELPTSCYEYLDGVLVVPGISGNEQFLDVTIMITGTVAGTPGTTVTNEACVTMFIWTGDEVACGTAAFQIAETPTEEPTATVTPTGTPAGTPTPDATGTPAPTDPADDGDDPAVTTTPVAGQAVTKLPSTGTDASSTSPMALYATVAAAVMLAGAGVLRLRGDARR